MERAKDYVRLWYALGTDFDSGQPIYSIDRAKALYEAVQQEPDADLVQLTCAICGLQEWHDDTSDIAYEHAAESVDPPDLDVPYAIEEWYREHHECERHSPLSGVWVQGWRDREQHDADMAAIEAALSPPPPPSSNPHQKEQN